MKTKVSLKMFVLSVVLLMTSFVASARSYDGQLVYNPVEENGVMVGQTVYKMNGSTLANYMKYNYKYDDAVKEEGVEGVDIRPLPAQGQDVLRPRKCATKKMAKDLPPREKINPVRWTTVVAQNR